MKAVAYTRVSTNQQVMDGESLSTQKSTIESYATMHSWELVKIFEDAGISGASDDRPALQALLQAAQNHTIDAVIVRDLSRFGRNTRDLLNNIHLLKEHKVDFVSIKEGVQPGPYGEFMLQVLASIYQLEREMILARTSENRLARWTDKRIFVGKTAFAYQWDKKLQQIVTIPSEVATYHRIVSDYLDKQLSMQTIAIGLDNDHVPTKQQGKIWNPVVISQILRNDTYWSGKISTKAAVFDCEPLIAKSKFDEIQRRVADAGGRSGRPGAAADTYLLYNLARCGVCGGRLSPGMSKSGTRSYACYWHDATSKALQHAGKQRCKLPPLNAVQFEESVWRQLTWSLIGRAEEHFEPLSADRWTAREDTINQKLKNTKTARKKATTVLANLDLLLENDAFDIATYTTKRNAALLQIRQTELEEQEALEELAKLETLKSEEQLLLNFGKDKGDALRQVAETIKELPFKKKRKLIAGLLAEPIKVHQPVEDIGWMEDEDAAPPEKPTYMDIFDCMDVIFRFNPTVIQEIFGGIKDKFNLDQV